MASVAASDLIQLIREPDDDHRINEDVFNDNIRVDLGSSNTINTGVRESALADDNYELWYLDNRITIVCDECNYLPTSRSPRVSLTNFQIVNGGQTTRILFYAYEENPERLGNVEVLIRFIETRDRSISEQMSESANRQTPIRTRDLRANDWVPRKIEEEFLSLGYYYERKKNQSIDQSKEKRLDAETVAQASLAFYLDMPSEAKDQKSIIFGEKYGEIFDEDSITASRLLFPVRLYKPIEDLKKVIQRKKRKKEQVTDEEAFVSLATFDILNGMKIIGEKESLQLEESSAADTAKGKSN